MGRGKQGHRLPYFLPLPFTRGLPGGSVLCFCAVQKGREGGGREGCNLSRAALGRETGSTQQPTPTHTHIMSLGTLCNSAPPRTPPSLRFVNQKTGSWSLRWVGLRSTEDPSLINHPLEFAGLFLVWSAAGNPLPGLTHTHQSMAPVAMGRDAVGSPSHTCHTARSPLPAHDTGPKWSTQRVKGRPAACEGIFGCTCLVPGLSPSRGHSQGFLWPTGRGVAAV